MFDFTRGTIANIKYLYLYYQVVSHSSLYGSVVTKPLISDTEKETQRYIEQLFLEKLLI